MPLLNLNNPSFDRWTSSSSLFGAEWPEGDEVAIRLGSLDGDPVIRPQFHTFVESRAPLDAIPDDGLPSYDEGRRD